MSETERATIFLAFSVDGGGEHMMVNLAGAMARQGIAVDLVRARVEGGHPARIPKGVGVVDLGTRHSWSSTLPLARYLRRASKPYRCPSGCAPGQQPNPIAPGHSALRRWLRTLLMRRIYHRAGVVIAVYRGIAEAPPPSPDCPYRR